MLQANSPGRINDRRIAAAARLEAQLASDSKQNSGHTYPLTLEERSRIRRQLDALTLRIRSADAARSIRTKKTPQESWTDARRAWRRGRITRA